MLTALLEIRERQNNHPHIIHDKEDQFCAKAMHMDDQSITTAVITNHILFRKSQRVVALASSLTAAYVT